MSLLDKLRDYGNLGIYERAQLWIDISSGTDLFDEVKTAVSDHNDIFSLLFDNLSRVYQELNDKRLEKITSNIYRHRRDALFGHEMINEGPSWEVLEEKHLWLNRQRRNFQILVGILWSAWQAWQCKHGKAMFTLEDYESESVSFDLRLAYEKEQESRERHGSQPLILQETELDSLSGWVRTFTGVKRFSSPVSVSIVNKNPDMSLRISILHLEVLEGRGEVFLHPADAFRTHPDKEFMNAIQLAWRGASSEVINNNLSGCFRILQDGKAVTWKPEGNSAGGAAYRGWLHGITQKWLDPEIVVLASLKSTSNLGNDIELDEVNGLQEKVEAIISSKKFDTIIVSNSKQQEEVERIIKSLNISEQATPRVLTFKNSIT